MIRRPMMLATQETAARLALQEAGCSNVFGYLLRSDVCAVFGTHLSTSATVKLALLEGGRFEVVVSRRGRTQNGPIVLDSAPQVIAWLTSESATEGRDA